MSAKMVRAEFVGIKDGLILIEVEAEENMRSFVGTYACDPDGREMEFEDEGTLGEMETPECDWLFADAAADMITDALNEGQRELTADHSQHDDSCYACWLQAGREMAAAAQRAIAFTARMGEVTS